MNDEIRMTRLRPSASAWRARFPPKRYSESVRERAGAAGECRMNDERPTSLLVFLAFRAGAPGEGGLSSVYFHAITRRAELGVI